MITDQIADLMVLPGRGPDSGFHVGQVITWNPMTGENVVDIAGSPIPNVSMLNIGDTVDLTVGDTVVVIRVKSRYFILGRVIPPGSPSFASQAVAFDARNTSESGFVIDDVEAGAEYATQVFAVPEWASEILVHAVVHCTGKNSRAVDDYLYGWVSVAGNGFGNAQLTEVDSSATGTVSASWSLRNQFTPGPEQTFSIGGFVWAFGGAWAADPLNQVSVSTIVVYRRA